MKFPGMIISGIVILAATAILIRLGVWAWRARTSLPVWIGVNALFAAGTGSLSLWIYASNSVEANLKQLYSHPGVFTCDSERFTAEEFFASEKFKALVSERKNSEGKIAMFVSVMLLLSSLFSTARLKKPVREAQAGA